LVNARGGKQGFLCRGALELAGACPAQMNRGNSRGANDGRVRWRSLALGDARGEARPCAAGALEDHTFVAALRRKG